MQADTRTIPDRLRAQAESLRRKPTPLADLIPLLQEAADALDRSTVRAPVDAKPWVGLADSDWVNIVNAPTVLAPLNDTYDCINEAVRLTEDRLRELNASAQEAAPQQGEILRFLLGEGPLAGVWFGDPHPTEQGAFWWRKHLRAAFAASLQQHDQQEGAA